MKKLLSEKIHMTEPTVCCPPHTNCMALPCAVNPTLRLALTGRLPKCRQESKDARQTVAHPNSVDLSQNLQQKTCSRK
jgi:hypothetical protein